MTAVRRGRFGLAILVAAGLVLSGPYIGVARAALRAAFPGRFGLIVNTAIAATLVCAAGAAIARIRERRWPRYSAMLAAAVLGVAFARYSAAGTADTIVVERFHFIEYGLVTFLFYRVWRAADDGSALVLASLMAFLVGIVDEGLQWFVPGRYGELRDIELNGAAILSGALFSYAVDPVRSVLQAWQRVAFTSLALVGGATLLALAVFIDVVHVGQLVHDSDEGAFLSRYSADALDALSRDRAQAWVTQPPSPSPPLLSREDQYATEALWHVQSRNEAWTPGDFRTAWRENAILEQYFSPTLDLGHRWAAAQRAEAQARGTENPGDRYVSTANRYPIYPWHHAVFRLVAGLLIVSLVLICLVAARTEPRESSKFAGSDER